MTVGGSRNTHWYVYFRTKMARARTGRTAPRSAHFGPLALGERPRIVQKPHQMHHGYLGARRSKPGDDLQDAAGIRAHDDVRTRRDDRRDLLALQLLRDVRLGQVVDAGATTAALGVGDLDDGDALDRTQ